MIHVCFQIHDENGTYGKYLGTAIYSLLKNTKSQLTIHLLHDGTLRIEDKVKLESMVHEFYQRIMFYPISVDDILRELDGEGRWYYSVGTFFRLYVLDVLSLDIDKIICLDADVVVHLDIKNLWDIPFYDNAIIAVQDMHIQEMNHPLCEKNILLKKHYFNAGVLVLNCKKIRKEYNLLKESIAFLRENYDDICCADQDALNYLFNTRCNYISNKYNLSVKYMRTLRKNTIENGIYHYLNQSYSSGYADIFDELYYHYFLSSPWGNPEIVSKCLMTLHQDFHLLQSRLREQRRVFILTKKIIYFGATGWLNDKMLEIIPLNQNSYVVDNDRLKWDQVVENYRIYSPQKLLNEKKEDIAIVVASIRYNEIKSQLEGYGYDENINFFDARALLDICEGGYNYNLLLHLDKKLCMHQ